MAAPLFALLLSAVILSAQGQAAMQAQSASGDSETIVTTAKETRMFAESAGVLFEDTTLRHDGNHLFLDDGVLLLASDGIASVHAGDLTAFGLRGGFMVIRSADAVSLLALTTPVLVARGGYRFVIPEGRRADWSIAGVPEHADLQDAAERVSTLQPMQEEFLRGVLADLRTITPPALPSFALPPTDPLPEFLALPAARERRREEEKARALFALRDALEQGDIAGARQAADDPLVNEALTSPGGGDALKTLLLRSVSVPSVGGELLRYLDDVNIWLLLSFHRDYRLLAWSTACSPSLPSSARELRWLLLPSSDIGEGVPATAIRSWESQVLKYLHSSRQPERFLNHLLASLKEYPAYAEREGFAERLRRYAAALQRLVAQYEEALSPQAQQLLASWKQVGVTPEYTEAQPLPVSQSSTPPVSSNQTESPAASPFSAALQMGSSGAPTPAFFNAFVLQEGVKALLQDAGALFLTTTTITAKSADAVAVENLVFVAGGAEHLFQFTMDPATRMISGAKRDGQPSLYALTFDAFVRWARGE